MCQSNQPQQTPEIGSTRCPICNEPTLRLIDHEPLDVVSAAFDSEIYATAKCDTCNNTCQVVGSICWGKPLSHKDKAYAGIWGDWDKTATVSYDSEIDILTFEKVSTGYHIDDVRAISALQLGETWDSPRGNHKLTRIS